MPLIIKTAFLTLFIFVLIKILKLNTNLLSSYIPKYISGYSLNILELIFIALISYSFISFYNSKSCKLPAPKITNISSNNTVFVFDLHGVIFNLSITGVIKDLIQYNHKFKLALACFNPFLIYDVLALLVNGTVVEKTILDIKTKHKYFQDLIPLALKITNNQVPNQDIVKLLRNLKNKNYKLLIFSNIGEKSINILEQKYPDVFKLFDNKLVANKKDNYIGKPSKEAFNKFFNKFKNYKNYNFILIDDKARNIKAAHDYNMSGILFTNANKLNKELSKLIN